MDLKRDEELRVEDLSIAGLVSLDPYTGGRHLLSSALLEHTFMLSFLVFWAGSGELRIVLFRWNDQAGLGEGLIYLDSTPVLYSNRFQGGGVLSTMDIPLVHSFTYFDGQQPNALTNQLRTLYATVRYHFLFLFRESYAGGANLLDGRGYGAVEVAKKHILVLIKGELIPATQTSDLLS